MKSEVFFISSRARKNLSPAQRLQRLINSINLDDYTKDQTVALKIHFGEEGATGYIHPTYARVMVNMMRERGLKPFLTDTNTLYHGFRSNGVDHLELAFRNGFSHSVVNAPAIIADGVKSKSVKEVKSAGKYFDSVKIGAAIAEADTMVTLNHFKGHLVTSFGGAIKNLSMGCASRATKQRMHADLKPMLRSQEDCTACGECALNCPVNAIQISDGYAHFELDRCIGCAECLSSCPYGVIKIQWSGSSKSVQEKMAEVAWAVVNSFNTQILHVNFLLNITPECDCLSWTDNPIVQDIGIMASFDPVALDQASLDQVTAVEGLANSVLPQNTQKNTDKFQLVHPGVDSDAQLSFAEELGLGSRNYILLEVTPEE